MQRRDQESKAGFLMAIFIPLVTKFDDKGLNNARNALSKFGSFAADVAKVAAAAIAAVGVASVREAAQFETSFAKIQGLVGVTAEELVLEEAARRLGPQFGKSGKGGCRCAVLYYLGWFAWRCCY